MKEAPLLSCGTSVRGFWIGFQIAITQDDWNSDQHKNQDAKHQNPVAIAGLGSQGQRCPGFGARCFSDLQNRGGRAGSLAQKRKQARDEEYGKGAKFYRHQQFIKTGDKVSP